MTYSELVNLYAQRPTMTGGINAGIQSALSAYTNARQLRMQEDQEKMRRQQMLMEKVNAVVRARELLGPQGASLYAQSIGGPDLFAMPTGQGQGVQGQGTQMPSGAGFWPGTQNVDPALMRTMQGSRSPEARRIENGTGNMNIQGMPLELPVMPPANFNIGAPAQYQPMGSIESGERIAAQKIGMGEPIGPEEIAIAQAKKWDVPVTMPKDKFYEFFNQQSGIGARLKAQLTIHDFMGGPGKQDYQRAWDEFQRQKRDAMQMKSFTLPMDPDTNAPVVWGDKQSEQRVINALKEQLEMARTGSGGGPKVRVPEPVSGSLEEVNKKRARGGLPPLTELPKKK